MFFGEKTPVLALFEEKISGECPWRGPDVHRVQRPKAAKNLSRKSLSTITSFESSSRHDSKIRLNEINHADWYTINGPWQCLNAACNAPGAKMQNKHPSKQTDTATQCTNYHMAERTHVPRRSCLINARPVTGWLIFSGVVLATDDKAVLLFYVVDRNGSYQTYNRKKKKNWS